MFTNNNTKHWCKCLDTLPKQIKQYPPKSGTISEPSTSSFTSSQRNPMFREISLPNILLRGHGCTRPSHPRPPSPRGAAGPRNRGLCGLPRAALFCLGSHGPKPSHGQNPTEPRGENSERNLGAPKVEVLEVVATQKSSLNFRNVVVLRCFDDIELVENHCCLWLFGSQDNVDNKPKHILQLRSKVRPKTLYFILFLQSKLRCRQRHNPDHKEQQKMLVQMSWHTGTLSIRSDTQNPRNTCTINIFTHFTTESHASRDFWPKSSSEATAVFVLCIHGRLRLEEPLDHGIVALLSCEVQRCVASGAAARGQATGRTQPNEGEKKSQKILGTPKKVKVLEIVATQKSSLDLRNIVLLRKF